MIIAMSIMWMVKVSIHEVIHMVPMGNGLVPAIRTMLVC